MNTKMDNKRKIIPHSKPTLGKEEEEAVIEVIRSGQIAQGEKVYQFERMIGGYIGRKYAIAVSSGLAALHLSLIALNIKEGDEVILPSYTCDALLNAVLYLNAQPKIVDVEYETGNISPDEVKKNITARTKAIIVPHSFGFPARIDQIVSFGIPVIEDCAVSIGAKYKNKNVGSFGLISVCSFYATKMLTTGEGGMILTDDEGIAAVVRELRDYTGHLEFRVRYNYKMTDIAAAMGIIQLKKLDSFIVKRILLADRYTSLLRKYPDLILPDYDRNGMCPVFYRYIVKIPGRDVEMVRNIMKEKGIFCGRAVLQPLHRLLGLPCEGYPNSEKLAQDVISLPIYPSLSEEDVDYIASEFINTLEDVK